MQFISGVSVSAFIFCISLSVSGAENQQDQLINQISQAIEYYENTPRQQWSFQVSNYENEEGDISSSVASFDPSRGEQHRWQLLSIDGATPNQKQINKFSKRHNKPEKEKNKERSFSFNLREIIVLESLQVASENDLHVQASFKVELEKLGKKASKKLQGVLTYNKTDGYIEQVVISNTEPFSPVFSADIKEFSLTFDFNKIQNAILPQKYHLSMKGSFAFFTEIDEVSSNTFSDYRFVE